MLYSDKIPYESCKGPAYILDLERLESNLQLIDKVQKEAGVSIIMALKAYANWRTFPLIGNYLSGATASSLNEARLIYEEMGAKVHAYFVAYRQDEFDELLKYCSHITFNSVGQYERFKNKIASSGYEISVGLRVNPEFSLVETDLYNPASQGSRLGVAPDSLENGWPEGIDGLHFHTLCESTSFDLEKTLEALEDKYGQFFPQLKWINMGGGHLITRADYDTKHLIGLLRGFKEKHTLDIIMEPGSAIVWRTGELVAEILDIHEARGVKTVILDVSFTAHMPDTLEMPYRPDIKGQKEGSKEGFAYRIGGLSCLSGDYLAEYYFAQPLEIGQKLIFADMIHYTTVKTTMFNGINHPSIIHWNGKSLETVRSFGYVDYKNRMA